jgi:hypothetical protein
MNFNFELTAPSVYLMGRSLQHSVRISIHLTKEQHGRWNDLSIATNRDHLYPLFIYSLLQTQYLTL